MSENKQVIEKTQRWIDRVVVGLNFCPFAKPVILSEKVAYQVSQEKSLDKALADLVLMLEELTSCHQLETALVIYPDGWEDFEDYLDLIHYADLLLIESGYEGIFQLASFHPEYCFEGAEMNDPANYTNRSPYPMIHIIREESLEKALQEYPNPENIPLRNQALAREKGLATMVALFQDGRGT